MTTRITNIILIMLILITLATLLLLAWHVVDTSRPVIRPGQAAPTKALPGAWYEKFGRHETCNPYVTS